MATMDSLPPIPTPPAQRWREFRIQILPVIVFVGIFATIILMWKNFVQPSGLVGEVEAVKVNVISLQDGVVAELHVDSLQYVTNGQVIGTIKGQILNVGAQFEPINPALISTDSNKVEMGLPILVSLPKGLNVSPGEFVDLSSR